VCVTRAHAEITFDDNTATEEKTRQRFHGLKVELPPSSSIQPLAFQASTRRASALWRDGCAPQRKSANMARDTEGQAHTTRCGCVRCEEREEKERVLAARSHPSQYLACGKANEPLIFQPDTSVLAVGYGVRH
jgi:hypothetical protein